MMHLCFLYKSKYPIIRSTEPAARPKGEPGKVWQDVGRKRHGLSFRSPFHPTRASGSLAATELTDLQQLHSAPLLSVSVRGNELGGGRPFICCFGSRQSRPSGLCFRLAEPLSLDLS